MKADLSRNTFDRAQHYSAVRLQQGRVVTDADWNEQADITRYRAERQALDTIGPCGAPLDGAGYGLVAETNAFAVHALGANEAWVVGEDGALLVTTSDGADWIFVDLGTSAHLRAITTADTVAWIVGDGGVILKSSDAGLTWSTSSAGAVNALFGVAAFATADTDYAWAVGDGGIVVATSDGGASWKLVQTDASRLYAVDFADSNNGLAVGQDGVIVTTSDGGDTWTRVDSGATAHLRAIARFDVTNVWIAGQGGTVLHSDDGGATWLPCTTPSTVTLYGIAFRDASEGWAVGEGGTVLHTVDGGLTWQQEGTIGSATLRGVSVSGSELAWVVGDGSAALRVGGGSPDALALALPAVNLSIEPGRYYVGGMLCEQELRSSYAHQLDGGTGDRLGPGAYLMYLDAWQRHISALEAPAIREVALGGPDTATRARTIAQVRALPLPDTSPVDWNCESNIDDWSALVGMSRPRLAARAEPQLATTNLCEIAATAGYRRLENQLYRVEVHDGGASPTFKWSRENGSVAYAVVSAAIDTTAPTPTTIVRVAARGRDSNLDLSVHDRVELIDDHAELLQRAGSLFEYTADGNDELELVLDGVPAGSIGQDPAQHPVLRRWDHKPTDAGTHVLPIVFDSWIELEDGVQVRFESGGVYRPGDYWQIPARTVTADVEWPHDEDGDPIALEPAGIADAYCRLGIVEVDTSGTVTVRSDCREYFPPLTALEQLLYVSGDGQDAAPNALLPQPLLLRVARGTVPIADAGVRFEVETGDGLVGSDPDPSFQSSLFETTTDENGLATCRWTLGPGATAPARYQRVIASLLDADAQPVAGQTIVYCATATIVLHYISGDGQEGDAGDELPYPLQARVTNGGDGVANVELATNIVGDGTVTDGNVTTDANGYVSVHWQLGAQGDQSLTLSLRDDDNNELQRIVYTARIAPAVTSGTGCDVTIGPGGQFDRLDSSLLATLLKEGSGNVCICFLPGTHKVGDINVTANGEARLCLHGCGPTARLDVEGGMTLARFRALEMRDLDFNLIGEGILLGGNTEVRLAGITIGAQPNAKAAALSVMDANRVHMNNCVVGAWPVASAVFDGIDAECHISECRFDGTVSFYGLPPDGDNTELLIGNLSNMERPFQTDTARLYFTDNTVGLLTLSDEMANRLVENEPQGLFQTAVLEGNTFLAQSNVFASGLLSFDGNTFVASPQGPPYGAMVANHAAAAGNVAVSVGDHATLFFLTVSNGFSQAANQIFILAP